MATLGVDDLLKDSFDMAKAEKLTFEEGLKLLEDLVQKVEAGQLPLEKAIAAYERGAALVGNLRKALSGAEERLKILNRAGEVK